MHDAFTVLHIEPHPHTHTHKRTRTSLCAVEIDFVHFIIVVPCSWPSLVCSPCSNCPYSYIEFATIKRTQTMESFLFFFLFSFRTASLQMQLLLLLLLNRYFIDGYCIIRYEHNRIGHIIGRRYILCDNDKGNSRTLHRHTHKHSCLCRFLLQLEIDSL